MTDAITKPQGIDVSNHQGHIDWQAVAGAGLSFAYIKVGGDLGFTDPYYRDNYRGAKDAGLLRGGYWFYRPARDAIAEAHRFCDLLGPLSPGDLQPALDMEVSDGHVSGDLVQKARAFAAVVRQRTGRDCILYTYPYFWQSAMHNSADFHDLALWIADYNNGAAPRVPGGWPTWSFWQTGWTGRIIPGIKWNVDTNVFNGSMAQLRKFAGL